MSDRIILAGDMALHSGLALGTTDRGYLASTDIDESKVRQLGGIAAAVRHMEQLIRDWVQQDSDVPRIDAVVYEEPAMHGRNKHALAQYAMVTALLLAADRLGATEVMRYWPSQVKKRATGSGKAEKDDMIRAAQKYTGWTVASHDEADAICLLKVALLDAGKIPQTELF